MLTTRIAEIAGVGRRLRFSRLGQSKTGPPLILAHGYPESLQIFERLAPLLADRFDVITFDWPGMGESEAWSGGASPTQMAERLVRILDHFELDSAFVVGMDMGAQPALVAAADWPDRIAGLAVMNSLVLWDEETSWEIRLLRERGWNQFVIEHFPRLVFFRAEHTFLPRSERLSGSLRRELWSSFRRREVRRYVSRMCAGYQGLLPHLPSYYERVQANTLVLWGAHDRHFPIAHAERLHEILPRSELAVVEDGWHWMVWRQPDLIAGHFHRFWPSTG